MSGFVRELRTTRAAGSIGVFVFNFESTRDNKKHVDTKRAVYCAEFFGNTNLEEWTELISNAPFFFQVRSSSDLDFSLEF